VNETLYRKLSCLAQGIPAKFIDLFAGCGGFSLGFYKAGFLPVGGVELDPHAIESHARNFFPSQVARHCKPFDITKTTPEEVLAHLAPDVDPALAVDVLIGGPPCQAFARIARAKLREQAAHPEAFKYDPRSRLYLRYLDYVRLLQPVALVMENVVDMLNHGGRNLPEEMAEALDLLGYDARYTVLNAVHYGVPQLRERLLLVAIRKELAIEPTFPLPTHWYELPPGYENARLVALRRGRPPRFTVPPAPHPELPRAVTAGQAIGDLPPLTRHLTGEVGRGPTRFDRPLRYRPVRPSDYAKAMRNWSGFESGGEINDHVTRSLPRDYQIFAQMQPGDQYPQAHAIACRLFEDELRRRRAQGERLQEGSREYERLRKQYVPPYALDKFPNKWRKMHRDQPARTLMAHLGRDGYTHIHYDSHQARTISVREAARLQSFPDGFFFAGTMNPAFRQIGNAVPPLLAAALAVRLGEELRRAARSCVSLVL
jgi:DNA (cytosine-5)-methyltransferase 1